MKQNQQIDYDSPWKEILESYFTEFMAFFFPKVYNDIDWERPHEFLDKELRQVMKDSEIGRRLVDKLVKVWRKSNGKEEWVLIHLEVQSQRDIDFSERMYVYNYRLYDRYNRKVASMAILGDEHTSWRPDNFKYELWGCKAGIEFPIIKLLDYHKRWSELEESRNPFATVIMAHLKTQETRKNSEDRKTWKFNLTKGLYERGYTKKDIMGLFKFIDWVMRLPKDLESELIQELRQYEEEKKMTYLSPMEILAIEKGRKEGRKEEQKKGLLDTIELGLDLKFGEEGLKLMPVIRELDDINVLKAIRSKIKPAKSLDELRRVYQK